MPANRDSPSRLSRSVLVLGSDTRSFLSVVRSLGRAGLTVDSAWTAPDSLARRSRYIRKVHDDLPRYSPMSREWLDACLRRVAEMQYDLVIPTNDPAILPLQNHRRELDPHRFYLLEERAFEVTSDKAKTHELAASLDIPVPGQKIVSTEAEADEAANLFGYPLILKPTQSFTLDGGDDKRFVRRAEGAESLRRLLPNMLRAGAVSVQPFFRGNGVGVEVLARGGSILASFQHERVHEPLQGGGSSYRKSVPVRPQLLDATARLMQALQYTGVAMVEFKVNAETGKFVLIEINGRFWGSLPLAVAAGANFPLWLYQMWVENRVDFSEKPKIGLYCRNLLADFDWFMNNLRADRTDPTLATVPLPKVAGEIWHLLSYRERFDTLVLDDLRPGIGELRTIAARIRTGLWKFLLTSHFSFGLRAFLRWRSLRRLRTARNVLFVCKGNICRSPFAAEYAKHALPHKEIRSGGYYPVPDRPSPGEAIAAALPMGVDLSRWRSSIVTASELREADAVVVFDQENYTMVCDASPDSASKIVLLGTLNEGPVFVEDPYGGSPDFFATIYTRIARAIDVLRDSQFR
jgi:protein-tyrosine-phosphatase/predicted ATP-grasp superfamily ATP-dependent carboligase